MVLDTRGRGGGEGGMADYCAQGFLQIRLSECLNVCEYMNMTERITNARSFHLLPCNSSMLMKERFYRKSFINTTNYGNKIYLDRRFAFAKIFARPQLLTLNRRITCKLLYVMKQF